MYIEHFSPSKKKTYDNCEFMYYLQYHLGLDLGTSFQAVQGTVCHKIYEDFGQSIKDNIKDPEIASKWTDMILEAYRTGLDAIQYGESKDIGPIWKLKGSKIDKVEKNCFNCEYHNDSHCFIIDANIDTFKGCPVEAFNQTIALTEQVINDRGPSGPLTHEILDCEHFFKIIIKRDGKEYPIRGIMDLVVKFNEDTIEIIDYKTGNYTQGLKQCQKDIQFACYHYAARKIWPEYKNIMVTAYYLKGDQVTVCFTPENDLATEQCIIDFFDKVQKNNNPKRIADKSRGRVSFDSHVCKYFCDISKCKKHHKNFVKNGKVALGKTKTLIANDKSENPLVFTIAPEENNIKELVEEYIQKEDLVRIEYDKRKQIYEVKKVIINLRSLNIEVNPE